MGVLCFYVYVLEEVIPHEGVVALRVISGKPYMGFFVLMTGYYPRSQLSISPQPVNHFKLRERTMTTYLHIHPCWMFLHTGMRLLHFCSTRSVSCNSPGGCFLKRGKCLQSESGVTVLESFLKNEDSSMFSKEILVFMPLNLCDCCTRTGKFMKLCHKVLCIYCLILHP